MLQSLLLVHRRQLSRSASPVNCVRRKMCGRCLSSSLVAAAMLILAAVHTADCNKYNYFDDFLFDSLNAGNSVLKPRGKNTQYVSRTANVVPRGAGNVRTEPRTTVAPEQRRQENVTAAASAATQRNSSVPRQPTVSSGTDKRRASATSTKLPSKQRNSHEQPVVATTAVSQATVVATAAPTAIGFGRFKPHRTVPPTLHWTTTAASDEDDDDDDDDDDSYDNDDKENDSDMESSGDRSDEDEDEDDDDSSEAQKNRKIMQKKHAKRQSSGVAMRQRDTTANGGRSNIESDLESMRDVPREHWSCCMLGKLAGDKGFDCHAQFYNRRLLDRNINRAHNRRLSDTYFANGRTTPGAMQLMTLFSTCVRSHAVEFHDCCREALDETVERRERWRRFEEVVAEVRIARQ